MDETECRTKFPAISLKGRSNLLILNIFFEGVFEAYLWNIEETIFISNLESRVEDQAYWSDLLSLLIVPTERVVARICFKHRENKMEEQYKKQTEHSQMI